MQGIFIEPQNNTSERQKQMSDSKKILIVEDSTTQAIKLKYILEQNGYAADIVTTGKEALSFLASHRPDLIISDVVMPEMDGFELCKRVKNDKKFQNIPIILLTTLSKPKDIITGLKSGADNFITKPYNEDYLISRIEYVLVNQEIRKNTMTEIGLEIYFAGQKHYFTAEKFQIIDLLLSTYETVLLKNQELEAKNQELGKMYEFIDSILEMLPTCLECEKVQQNTFFKERLKVLMESAPAVKGVNKFIESYNNN